MYATIGRLATHIKLVSFVPFSVVFCTYLVSLTSTTHKPCATSAVWSHHTHCLSLKLHGCYLTTINFIAHLFQSCLLNTPKTGSYCQEGFDVENEHTNYAIFTIDHDTTTTSYEGVYLCFVLDTQA